MPLDREQLAFTPTSMPMASRSSCMTATTGWLLKGYNAARRSSHLADYIWTLGVKGTRAGSDINYYNYGRPVNVFAPGRDVWTTRPHGGYGTVGGTSSAVPLVAGIAALVKVARPHPRISLGSKSALQQTTLIRRTMRPLLSWARDACMRCALSPRPGSQLSG